MPISFEEAQAIILQNVEPLGSEQCHLFNATGRVLAEEIICPRDMPLWNNSAMDGFAVRAEDCNGSATLKVTGYIPAGGRVDGLVVEPGTAIKIMTGAPTPSGCNAVIPIEEVEEVADHITIKGRVEPKDHVRFRGEDVKAGEGAIPARTELRPAEINMLAAFGLTSAPVFKRPQVAILSTGDELIEPGNDLAPGMIIDSNSLSLAAAVQEAGGEPLLIGIARDNKESLYEKLSEGLQADMLITSAGVSAGDRDLVREILQELEVEQLFWKVQVKPGRPTAFGLKSGKPVFSLPGNPVSSLITFEEFVRPALRKMMGHKEPVKPYVTAILRESITKKAGRTHFLRVRVVKEGEQLLAASAGDQNTGILKTLVSANGIAKLSAEREQFAAGEAVAVHLLSHLDIL